VSALSSPRVHFHLSSPHFPGLIHFKALQCVWKLSKLNGKKEFSYCFREELNLVFEFSVLVNSNGTV
jgi:hypothetical protein